MLRFLHTLLATSAFLLLSAQSAWADDGHRGRSIGKSFELTPFASYYFEGEIGSEHDFGFSFDDVDVEAGEGAGILAAFRVNRHWQVELMYSQQETEFEFRRFRFNGPDFRDSVEVDLEYFHVGVAYTWALGQIEPFVDVTIGTTNISPKGPGIDEADEFSVGVGGGVKVFVSEHLGFRFQGRILSTDVGRDDFFCEDDFGFDDCYYYDEDSYLVQPEISVGLILAF
ncbi:MAG: porin family protein [Thermoanaerobaculia bacterium]|nr:porin family protein [Thermoanaerobaculia bacterium]